MGSSSLIRYKSVIIFSISFEEGGQRFAATNKFTMLFYNVLFLTKYLWATTDIFSCYCDLWKIHIHVFVSLSLEVDLCKRGQSFENWKEFCGQSFENWKIEKFWQLENKKVWKIEKSFGGAADKGALSTLSHLRTSANPITINNTLNTTYFQLRTPPSLLSKRKCFPTKLVLFHL